MSDPPEITELGEDLEIVSHLIQPGEIVEVRPNIYVTERAILV
jgi:hypothetical protein